jgi:pyrroloquinoline quinone (PQQ) biosynthesis protein C
MTVFQRIVEATAQDYADMIENSPLLALVKSGRMTLAHYKAYLRETYHLVRHTPRMLALGGARLGDDRRELRNWFFEQVTEENGHDLFCIKDLESLGENPRSLLAGMPGKGVWGLVCQNYFMATYGNPVGILGVATATEGLGAEFGTHFADLLTHRYELRSNATTFLRSHGGFDGRHLAEAVTALEYVRSNEVEEIIHARRMTLQFYGQMFLDVLAAVPAREPAVQEA